MKTATVHELKKELEFRSHAELLSLCLRLSKFKKENKELLSYLLYEAHDEESYIASIKELIDLEFEQINVKSFFYIKKTCRKILRMVKKFIRYSNIKETEVALLLYFCYKLKNLKPNIFNNTVLSNMYNRQLFLAKKTLKTLHTDLQYDYQIEIDDLEA